MARGRKIDGSSTPDIGLRFHGVISYVEVILVQFQLLENLMLGLRGGSFGAVKDGCGHERDGDVKDGFGEFKMGGLE